MRRIDRSSATDAQLVLESFIPDPAIRQRWLGLLADVMATAHEIHPGSWAVTLFDAGLRLNVGQIETVVLWPGSAMLVLDSSHFSDDELDEIRRRHGPGSIDAYTSVRGTVQFRLAYGLDDAATIEARDALVPVVERAAARVKTRTGYSWTHSQGVVEYVADATGRRLPPPDYGEGQTVRRR